MIGIRPRELDRGEDDWAPCTCDAASALQMREGRVCVCEAGAIVRGADERQFNTSRIESRTGFSATGPPTRDLRSFVTNVTSGQRSTLCRRWPGAGRAERSPRCAAAFPVHHPLPSQDRRAACASDGSCEARTTTRSKADGTSGIRIRRGCSPASVGRPGPA